MDSADLPHGIVEIFSPEGVLLSRQIYDRGILSGECRTYYSNGAPCSVEHWFCGKRFGAQRSFYQTGAERTVEQYREGLREGESLLYWPNGALKRRCCFASGKKQGADEIWSEDGILLYKSEYDHGIPR